MVVVCGTTCLGTTTGRRAAGFSAWRRQRTAGREIRLPDHRRAPLGDALHDKGSTHELGSGRASVFFQGLDQVGKGRNELGGAEDVEANAAPRLQHPVHLPGRPLPIGEEHDRLLTQHGVELGVGNRKLESAALQELDLVEVGRCVSRDLDHGCVQLDARYATESANTKGGVARYDSCSARHIQNVVTRLQSNPINEIFRQGHAVDGHHVALIGLRPGTPELESALIVRHLGRLL